VGGAPAGAQPSAPSSRITPLPAVTTASRVGADSTRSLQVIDRAMLDRLPGTSVQAALQWALGSDLRPRSPAQADFALRGATYEQTLILVDGQRMRDLQTGHFALDLAVPYEAIDRIEILRGPAAAQYGADAVGGVVHIITRADVRAGRLRLGTFGLRDVGASVGGRRGAVTGSLHADHQRSTGHRPGTDFDIGQLRLSGRYQHGTTRAALDAGTGTRAFGATTFYAPFDSYERTGTQTAALRLEGLAGTRTAWMLRSGLRRHTDDFILVRTNPARYRNQHTSHQAESELSARIALSSTRTIALGAEWLAARLRSTNLGDRDQQRAAAFVEARQRWRRMEGTVGGRLEGSSDFGTQATPSAAIRVHLHPEVTMRGSLAGGWRQPTWTDRYYVDPANRGTPTLQPERFLTQEVGLTWQADARLHLDWALFDRRGRETIDWVRPLGITPRPAWVATNLGTTRATGTEVLLQGEAGPALRWTARAAALRATTERGAGLEGKYALRPLTRSAGATVQVTPSPRLWVLADIVHARRSGEQSWTTAALRLGTTIAGIDWSLEGTNLGSAGALDASGVPMAGPSLTFGLHWRP